MYYTVIKRDGHLRTEGNVKKHEPQASVSTFLECFQMSRVFYHSVIHGLGFFICFMIKILRSQNKTRFFYVLYSDKTWVFDQSERAQGPISVIISIINKGREISATCGKTKKVHKPSHGAEFHCLPRQVDANNKKDICVVRNSYHHVKVIPEK